jgi:hypothetical protein
LQQVFIAAPGAQTQQELDLIRINVGNQDGVINGTAAGDPVEKTPCRAWTRLISIFDKYSSSSPTVSDFLFSNFELMSSLSVRNQRSLQAPTHRTLRGWGRQSSGIQSWITVV